MKKSLVQNYRGVDETGTRLVGRGFCSESQGRGGVSLKVHVRDVRERERERESCIGREENPRQCQVGVGANAIRLGAFSILQGITASFS
jgi:hypothetical protein